MWFSLIVPPFETPDEPFHYAFARHISSGNGLPVQQPEVEQPWSHEGSQAPLYYLLTGLITAGIDQSDYAQISVRNPRANMGDPLFPGNKNFMLYSGAGHALTGANLALHIGRWISLLLGGSTLWFIWLTVRLTLPGQHRIHRIALVLTATIPQFLFISASFTNDSLVTTVSACTVYVLCLLVTRLYNGHQIEWWKWFGLGMLLGLAALSKLNGLGLTLLTAVIVWSVALHTRKWHLPWHVLLQAGLPFLLIAGWWYWRNLNLYGDILGANQLLAINGQRSSPPSWLELWNEFRGLRYSFWGLFGWFNIPLPEWTYHVFDWAVVVAFAGGIGWLCWTQFWPGTSARLDPVQPNSPALWVLIAWLIIPLGLIAYWAMRATSSQGRLLFPSLNSIVILTIVGFDFWIGRLPPKWHNVRRIIYNAIPAFTLACTLYTLVVLIPWAYYPQPPVDKVAEKTIPVNITFGNAEQGQDEFTILGIALTGQRYRVGEDIPVTLYLQTNTFPQTDAQLFIQLLDEQGSPIANMTSHPGWGRNPTTLWQPGVIYADHYLIRVEEDIESFSPLAARVYTGFIDPSTLNQGKLPLPARNPAGNSLVPIVATVTILPSDSLDLASLPGFIQLSSPGNFNNAIELLGYDISEDTVPLPNRLTVSLLWEASAALSTEYVAYVHLLSTSGERVAGFDQPPGGERFPTSAWLPGDQVLSTFSLDLPENIEKGKYELWVGLYEKESQGAVRLPVRDAGELVAAHNQLRLGSFSIQ